MNPLFLSMTFETVPNLPSPKFLTIIKSDSLGDPFTYFLVINYCIDMILDCLPSLFWNFTCEDVRSYETIFFFFIKHYYLSTNADFVLF